MAIENVGPGGVGNNYGVRETVSRERYDLTKEYIEEYTDADGKVVTAETDLVTGVIKFPGKNGDMLSVANARAYGLKGDGITNDQVAMDTLMASDIDVILFPKGVYRTYMNNKRSNRTFIFEEGAIIDGVAHIAVGSGPDVGGGPITLVENTRVIGTIASTVRIGTYYCKKLNVDKMRIVDVNPAYFNQTVEGGTRGVHIHTASHDVKVGEIYIDSATYSGYALGIDPATTLDADHYPMDIHIGKLTVNNNTQSASIIAAAIRCSIGEIVVNGFGNGLHGNSWSNCTGLKIGKITVDGTGVTGNGAGIYSLNNTADIGEVCVKNCPSIGYYVNQGYTKAGYVEASGCGTDGIRLLTKADISKVLVFNNTQRGLNIANGASNSVIGHVESYSNVMDNVFVDTCSDVEIDSVVSHDATGASGWGLFVNGCTRFRCNHLRSYGNKQGLRYIGNTDSVFGTIRCTGNVTNDIALSGTNTGLRIIDAVYSTISGGPLEAIAGFKTLTNGRPGSQTIGDAAATLTVATSAVTQKWNTPLTADRAVTLSNTGAKPGDKFRIVRTAAATGAFNLNVGTGPLKALSAAGQWCDVEFDGSAWALVGYGSL